MLKCLLISNIATVFSLFIVPAHLAFYFSLLGSLLQVFFSAFLFYFFDVSSDFVQDSFVVDFSSYLPVYDLSLDSINIFFILLSVFLLPVCVLVSWSSVFIRVNEFHIMLHLVILFLLQAFTVQDLFYFYIFFEATGIPMFVIILIWGSRSRKVHAAYQYLFYTVVGSILMLVAILCLWFYLGSTHVSVLATYQDECGSFDKFLWLAIFFCFVVKFPLFPFYIWLPEAHVEAPTAGSVLLAGIVLKLSAYGIVKFLIPIFPLETAFFKPLVNFICLLTVIFSSLSILRQFDFKKIVAYSSVGHMAVTMMGFVSGEYVSFVGSFYFLFVHGVTSSALFICVGMLYERYGTRNILYYSALACFMPRLAFMFFCFSLINIGFPGTAGFISELLVFLGVWSAGDSITVVVSLYFISLTVFTFLWLFNRLFFGIPSNLRYFFYLDLTSRESFVVNLLLLLSCVLSLLPVFILHQVDYFIIDYLLLFSRVSSLTNVLVV